MDNQELIEKINHLVAERFAQRLLVDIRSDLQAKANRASFEQAKRIDAERYQMENEEAK